ncbi:helix-turn-helix domain-containing protein [Cupriavidus sp. TA19]|uniref:helix-turn-helix domain-containing protein n=1 Tax=Cupriavidus sp. TA19 TaxID=701108 RepID=UPI00295E9E8C|nr:helix-turn-helix domain-containing protein [Cupriavidus sp. TA19]
MSAISTFEPSPIENLANWGRPCMCGGRWVTIVPTATGRLEEMEREAILDAIAKSHENMSMAARTLGISRSTLYVKLAAIRAQSSSSSSGM